MKVYNEAHYGMIDTETLKSFKVTGSKIQYSFKDGSDTVWDLDFEENAKIWAGRLAEAMTDEQIERKYGEKTIEELFNYVNRNKDMCVYLHYNDGSKVDAFRHGATLEAIRDNLSTKCYINRVWELSFGAKQVARGTISGI